MFIRRTRVSTRILFLSLLSLSACGAAPSLISKSAIAPDGVDFSGMWQVRPDPEAERLADNAALRDGLILTNPRSESRRSRSGSDRSVQVFLEFGKSLKITQTGTGLFISYDRSVVEEFRFGENRVIAIGPIEALRASGWEGEMFVVETLDDAGSILMESWRFDGSRDVLVRNIRISKGDREIFSRQQIFDRQ
jgi:hypothetical protein